MRREVKVKGEREDVRERDEVREVVGGKEGERESRG